MTLGVFFLLVVGAAVIIAVLHRRSGHKPVPQPWREQAPPPLLLRDVIPADARVPLILYAIGWEVEQIEWWPYGSLDHEKPVITWTLRDDGVNEPEFRWEFKELQPVP